MRFLHYVFVCFIWQLPPLPDLCPVIAWIGMTVGIDSAMSLVNSKVVAQQERGLYQLERGEFLQPDSARVRRGSFDSPFNTFPYYAIALLCAAHRLHPLSADAPAHCWKRPRSAECPPATSGTVE